MITDASGGLWPIIQVVGPLVLFAALVYGVMAYRRGSSRLKQEGDRETERLYQQKDR
jgi:hypothetical protein